MILLPKYLWKCNTCHHVSPLLLTPSFKPSTFSSRHWHHLLTGLCFHSLSLKSILHAGAREIYLKTYNRSHHSLLQPTHGTWNRIYTFPPRIPTPYIVQLSLSSPTSFSSLFPHVHNWLCQSLSHLCTSSSFCLELPLPLAWPPDSS